MTTARAQASALFMLGPLHGYMSPLNPVIIGVR
jgi:hypothetical protein